MKGISLISDPRKRPLGLARPMENPWGLSWIKGCPGKTWIISVHVWGYVWVCECVCVCSCMCVCVTTCPGDSCRSWVAKFRTHTLQHTCTGVMKVNCSYTDEGVGSPLPEKCVCVCGREREKEMGHCINSRCINVCVGKRDRGTHMDKGTLCVRLLCLEPMCICFCDPSACLQACYNIYTHTHYASILFFNLFHHFSSCVFICVCVCVWKVKDQPACLRLGFHMTEHLCCSPQGEDWACVCTWWSGGVLDMLCLVQSHSKHWEHYSAAPSPRTRFWCLLNAVRSYRNVWMRHTQ